MFAVATAEGIGREPLDAFEPVAYAGPVLAAADRHGVDVPLLRALPAQLAEVEADRRAMSETRLAVLDDIATKEVVR